VQKEGQNMVAQQTVVNQKQPMIISASRRTDIPAHYTEWLLSRLSAGFCEVFHPYSKQWLRVSLRPEDVYGIVFWTKDASPLITDLPDVRRVGYPFYIHFTITGLPPELEPNVPPTGVAVQQVKQIAARFGPDCVQWRFDPIVHTTEISPQNTIDRFTKLCQALEGATRRCFFSFMSPYRRQQRAFAAAGVVHVEDSPEKRRELAMRLAEIAAEYGISMYACCSPDLVVGHVQPACCVDPELLNLQGANIQNAIPKAPSRKYCNCRQSVDIGAYDTCIGGCIYCYANQNKQQARKNFSKHDPTHAALAQALLDR